MTSYVVDKRVQPWLCIDIGLCPFQKHSCHLDKHANCIRQCESPQTARGPCGWLPWGITRCLRAPSWEFIVWMVLIKTMRGSRRSQLGNPRRSPEFTVFAELYQQPKVASFSFLGSLATQSCNLLAVAMEMARESWLIRSEEFVPFWSRYLYKSSIQIIYENWVTVPYGSCKCCYLNWLKGTKMTPLISSLFYPAGPLRLLC